jgi:beta-glucosidase
LDSDKAYFEDDFNWGVSSSALQSEGAWNEDGKGLSNWDFFALKKKKILHNHTPAVAADFYHRYEEDIAILSALNIPNFRFSLSWSRILPDGTGKTNRKGIDFYNRVIDTCLKENIQPWVTLYHWDLPQALEESGGWTNRDMLRWFEDYVISCVDAFGDRVKHWMVLNEPMVFTGAGYYLGIHAPGKKRFRNFLPAIHHAVLCQALGVRIIKSKYPKAEAGSTFSCSYVTPHTVSEKDGRAVKRIDALLNRLFIEPALGLGYPVKELSFLKKIEKYMRPGDEQLMKADFDFIGIQNYTREVVAHAFHIPHLKAKLIPADKRKVYHTFMDWEVYPESIYEMIKQFSNYKGVKKVIVTENGAAFHDTVANNAVHDLERIHFLTNYIAQVQRAKEDGLKVNGYFVWSLTDNFEWAEGYLPRFGLVYVDYETQRRIIKDSGHWYGNLVSNQRPRMFNPAITSLL